MHLRVAAAFVLLSLGSAKAEPCGNLVHNLNRARECEAYTSSDWGKKKDLRDVRIEMLQEWHEKTPLAGTMLEHVLKDADINRSWALTRDTQIFGKDEDMWKQRGCAELPLCPKVKAAEKAEQDDAYKPEKVEKAEKPAPQKPRNRRTGGNYCGPRDTARGYCD